MVQQKQKLKPTSLAVFTRRFSLHLWLDKVKRNITLHCRCLQKEPKDIKTGWMSGRVTNMKRILKKQNVCEQHIVLILWWQHPVFVNTLGMKLKLKIKIVHKPQVMHLTNRENIYGNTEPSPMPIYRDC